MVPYVRKSFYKHYKDGLKYCEGFNGSDEEGEELDEPAYLADDPAELVIEAQENLDLIDRLKKALSPMEKQVFDLYMQDFDYKEIAVKLGKPEKSIDNDDILLRQLVFPDEIPETAQAAADGAVHHQPVQPVVLALQRLRPRTPDRQKLRANPRGTAVFLRIGIPIRRFRGRRTDPLARR